MSERPLAAAALAALVVGVVGVAAADGADAPPSAVDVAAFRRGVLRRRPRDRPGRRDARRAPRPRRQSPWGTREGRGTALFRLRRGVTTSASASSRAQRDREASAKRVWSLPNDAQRCCPRPSQRRLALGGKAAAFPRCARLGARPPHRPRRRLELGQDFPAASIVKLGVLVAALDRWGAQPADPRIAKEIRDLAIWSPTWPRTG